MTAQTQETIALYAEFTAQEGKAEQVEELLMGLRSKVRAEPGNITFDPHRRRESPNDFFVYEIYRDQQAFDAHISADYGKVFNNALTELIVGSGSTLTFLTPLQ